MFHGSSGAVPVNHRPLGYECHHQQDLKTMCGAKSNALFLITANCNPACPCVALVVSDRVARPSQCARGRDRRRDFRKCRGAGLSDERRFQRVGFGARHRDRDHWGLNITLACGAGAYLAAVTLSPVLIRRKSNA
jgi:hypothetical protein